MFVKFDGLDRYTTPSVVYYRFKKTAQVEKKVYIWEKSSMQQLHF